MQLAELARTSRAVAETAGRLDKIALLAEALRRLAPAERRVGVAWLAGDLKTFKGMTDELLAWQTERLRALAIGESDEWVVHVRPELVVEVAFDGVQASPRYPSGLTLRFARVVRYRTDKRPDEADTIDAVRALHAGEVLRGAQGA